MQTTGTQAATSAARSAAPQDSSQDSSHDSSPGDAPGDAPGAGTVRRRDLLRRRLAWCAVVACAPYLGLKLLWIAGLDAGVVDPGRIDRAAWIAANALTFVMDGVAAFIAYTLTRPATRRGRAWLILPPLWVASGLLAVIMLAVPLGIGGALVGGGPNPFGGDDFLRGWVYGVVYGGFIVEGAVLLGAFVLYAGERWGALLNARRRDLRPALAGSRVPFRGLGAAGAALLAGAGVLRLAWAAGSDFGMTAAWTADRDATSRALDCVQGGLALAGAAGLALLVLRTGGGKVRGPLALAWVGTASAFGWGGWLGLATVVAAPDSELALRTSGLLRAVYTAEMITGLLVLTAGWYLLTRCARHFASPQAAGSQAADPRDGIPAASRTGSEP
ncbi:hypothetical protein [Yinghuangia soli]|uniref:Uncharacterized protein n=1 Tax=Yinghuangia soli TaxID=2908204 RepID=A0AA41U3Y1_9ACTN|nr:hypothetical protein [Yinghuangia soli]MCF2532291.1 hypothetical protein [Yinghuangia soli]